MSKRDPQSICQALSELKNFFIYFGHSERTRIQPLDGYIQRFQSERPSAALVSELEAFTGELRVQAEDQIRGRRFLPGPHNTEQQTKAELQRVFVMLRDAIDPPEPEWPRMDISGFAGSEFLKGKDTAYLGSPAEMRPIVERSIVLLRRHSEAIGRGDYESAYQNFGVDLRAWMSLKKFESAHADATRRYGGPPREFAIHGFAFVLADNQARKKSTNAEGWPKTTPKENRRAQVTGFWIRDAQRHGCHGSFWITEEDGEYRIAKFNFWAM
ncbi:MAG TPA: hypothetical protein VFZ59_20615 [Verrucomicrobiae bacterium]|nr:hypothetical protein [Verrucomicrobiae bacterium]